MKRMSIASVCLCLCLCFLSACARDASPKDGETCMYYLNTSGTGLVKRVYTFTGKSVDAQIDNTLTDMQKETDSIDYKSPFPQGLAVESSVLDGTTLHLYFESDYAEMNTTQELLFRAAVMQTLIQIEGVDDLCFYVDGDPLTDAEGRETGYMNEDDFVQNTGSGLHSYQEGDLRLYFANAKGDKLVAEDVRVRYNSNMSKEKLIVEKLLKGPETDEAHPVIPTETEILGVSTKNGICYVNFSDQFLTAEYEMDAHLTIYALVNSIVENSEASQVQILVNGETDISYQGNIDLSKPFSSDYSYVEEED